MLIWLSCAHESSDFEDTPETLTKKVPDTTSFTELHCNISLFKPIT